MGERISLYLQQMQEQLVVPVSAGLSCEGKPGNKRCNSKIKMQEFIPLFCILYILFPANIAATEVHESHLHVVLALID